MYVWVVLATFLAMLASYTLAPRSDMRKLTVEPLAEADLAKLLVQHRSAYEFVSIHTQGDKAYRNGKIGNDTLKLHMNLRHYEYDEDDPNRYHSEIYCLNKNMDGPAGCWTENAHNVLVTYGPIPERWVNLDADPEKPSVDFLNAIRNTADSGLVVGYTEEEDTVDQDDEYNPSGSKIRIVDGRGTKKAYVPKGVANSGGYRQECDDKVCMVVLADI